MFFFRATHLAEADSMTRSLPVRLAVLLTCVVPLLLPAPAAAQVRKTGRVHVINSTAREVTITCRAYYDAFGTRQLVKGGSWSVKAFVNGPLDDLGKPLYASRFEFTITSTEGSSQWYSTAFNAAGNLTVTVDADVFKRHLASLPGRAMPAPRIVMPATPAPRFVPAPVVPAPVVRAPAAGPSKEAAQRAVGKVIVAALANAAAKAKMSKPKNFGEALLQEGVRQAALRVRDAAIEGALKDVFPTRTAREIQAARLVIALELDGKLTLRNLERARAKEELLAQLRRYDAGAGSAAEVADFIYDVVEAHRRRR